MSETPPNPAELSLTVTAHEEQPPIPVQPSESWENPQEQAPMLDVHPAHHAASTWRDFFIHIATIVLGLIIAVGLEQTVEYVHHRHQARDARTNILDEVRVNLDILQDNQKDLTESQQQLAQNLDLLTSGAPDAKVLQQFGIDYYLTRRHDSAWNAAKLDGSLALIPPDQIGHANYFYEAYDALSTTRFEYFADMDTIAALILHARPSGKLTPPERQLLLSLTASAMGHNRLLFKMGTSQIHALQSKDLQ